MENNNRLYVLPVKGVPVFPSPGRTFREILKNIVYEANRELGYRYIETSYFISSSTLQKTGHDLYYNKDFYNTDDKDLCVKPMNCPGFLEYVLQFGTLTEDKCNSIEFAEDGMVARTEYDHEIKDDLRRVKMITIDDSHALRTSEEAAKELIKENLRRMLYIYKSLGFSFEDENFEVAITRGKPEGSFGTEEEWEKSDALMEEVLEDFIKEGLIPENKVKELPSKDAAFYGPKINVRVFCGKKWTQCGTVQFDRYMPKEMGVKYIGKDKEEHSPFMIHRAFFGSYERAIEILMEKYKGRFPAYLSPVKARIITRPYDLQEVMKADELADRLYKNHGIEVEIDSDDITIENKEERFKKAKYEKGVEGSPHFVAPYLLKYGENGELLIMSRDEEGEEEITEEKLIDMLSRNRNREEGR